MIYIFAIAVFGCSASGMLLKVSNDLSKLGDDTADGYKFAGLVNIILIIIFFLVGCIDVPEPEPVIISSDLVDVKCVKYYDGDSILDIIGTGQRVVIRDKNLSAFHYNYFKYSKKELVEAGAIFEESLVDKYSTLIKVLEDGENTSRPGSKTPE